MKKSPIILPLLAAATAWGISGAFSPDTLWAQAAAAAGEVVRIVAEPAAIELRAGEQAPLQVRAFDARGNVVDADFRYTAPRGSVSVANGFVLALESGEHEVVATLLPAPGISWAADTPPMVTVPVRVRFPTVAEVRIESADGGRLYEGTTLAHRATALHGNGSERPSTEARPAWSSSAPAIASVDRFGNVTAHGTGAVTIHAEIEGVRGSVRYDVAPFPATRLELSGGADQARAGDVLRFEARAFAADGREIRDLPITWSHTFTPSDSIGMHAGGSGLVRDGRFVGELPGIYTIIANAGQVTARRTIEISSRGVIRPTEVLGRGSVTHAHTSEFWVFEGRDGRDYAILGTWSADGWTYMFDVTDPTNIFKTDSLRVDARTVNNVRVSPDSRYATLTREGASNRRNGLVILDLEDPSRFKVASTIEEGLTGGVHTAFPDMEYAFVLSGGERYLIFDMRDIYNPRYLSTVEIPGARIHDVWVHNGIAYSAQRPVGGVIVDVGNGRWGGSPENPVVINITGAMPEGGGFHTVFPYYQASTGRMLLILADEIFTREGHAWGSGRGPTGFDQYDPETGTGGIPQVTSGYVHILDVTDPENAEVIARYHVPEFGSHNTWVEDDILYQAYFEGGIRLVDISGELMGDLHRQDREIAVYKAFDPNGYLSNAPFAHSVMPFKDNVFFTDMNSGLWSVKVEGLNRPLIP